MADEETPGERLALIFELFELGVEVMAANLHRRYPAATVDEIDRHLDAARTASFTEPTNSKRKSLPIEMTLVERKRSHA